MAECYGVPGDRLSRYRAPPFGGWTCLRIAATIRPPGTPVRARRDSGTASVMHASRLSPLASTLASTLAVIISVAAFGGGAPVSWAGTVSALTGDPSGDPSAGPAASVDPPVEPPSGDPGASPDPTLTASPSAEPTAEPSASPSAEPSAEPTPTASPSAEPTASPKPTPAPTPVVPASDTLRLRRLVVIRGAISPKSVVATQTGLVFAQNMMYRHTMTVYDTRGRLVKTISDRVALSRFGFSAYPLAVNGAPVEAAAAPDGRHIYVSQYSMYGYGFRHPGWDTGWVDDVIDRSFVYEIDTRTLRVTRVIRVGPVPKAVGVSPDGKWLLVGNWTHRDVSLVNLRTGREVKRIVVGGNPRGIAFAPDSSVVYLTAESGQRLMEYNFSTGRLRTIIALLPGEPRHLVIDPTGRYLYASLNRRGQVVKIDIRLRRIVDRVTTGSNPRTIALAPDGRSLYVVNYESRTVAKVRTKDMLVLQRLTTAGVHPVGLAYENATRTIWVSCYRGTIERFADR